MLNLNIQTNTSLKISKTEILEALEDALGPFGAF